MARNKVDQCMFCSSTPCQCGKPALIAKTAKVTAPKVPAPKVPAPKSVRPDSGPLRIPSTVPQSQSVAAQPVMQTRQVISEDEMNLRRALTCLAPLISAEDLERHRDKIDLPPWRIDALIWSQGNE